MNCMVRVKEGRFSSILFVQIRKSVYTIVLLLAPTDDAFITFIKRTTTTRALTARVEDEYLRP